jgi:hypothetical protein
MRRAPVFLVLLLVALTAHAEQDFSGTTASGAYYRIAVPDGWKSGDTLILFQHGLTFDPPKPVTDLGPIADLQLSEGYAIAASSYSQRSWALFTAPDDNAEMLAAFKERVGTPGAIIPWGGSLGGLVALKLAEDPRFAPVPGVYAACTPAAGSRVWDAGFDLRLAYDVVCAGAGDLPKGDQPYPWAYNLSDIPDNLSDLEDEALLLQTLIPLNQCTGINLPKEVRNDAMKRRLTELMSLGYVTSEKFFVTNTAYATYALSDLVRAPDKLDDLNPFSNIGVDYGDATINANIARIDANPFASLYFRDVSDFRGKIGGAKVVSVHTSQDQLVIPANEYVLRQTLPTSQLTIALVNESTPSHCGFTDAEGVGGWEALRAWIAGAPQPSVNDLQTACTAAMASGSGGPCRYDANISVPTFDSQVHPRQASTAPPVDARYSGQWYDPARNGEGIALEVLDDNRALVYMFTYPPSGVPGQQAWLLGVGDVLGNGIEFTDVLRSSLDSGGHLQAAHWGRMGLVFDDCNNGHMRWDGPAAWGSLEVPITRITALSGLDCTAPASAIVPTQTSGSWYDARYLGSGFVFEQLDAQRVAAIWFGFDSAGNQAWLSGIGQQGVDGYAGIFYQPIGPRFGSAYDPAAFNPQQRGALSGLKVNCLGANGTVVGFPGLPDEPLPFELALTRFTFPAGIAKCNP